MKRFRELGKVVPPRQHLLFCHVDGWVSLWMVILKRPLGVTCSHPVSHQAQQWWGVNWVLVVLGCFPGRNGLVSLGESWGQPWRTNLNGHDHTAFTGGDESFQCFISHRNWCGCSGWPEKTEVSFQFFFYTWMRTKNDRNTQVLTHYTQGVKRRTRFSPL